MRARLLVLAILVFASVVDGPAQAARSSATSGLAMVGTDRSAVQLPVVGLFESYENAGYRVRVEGGRAWVKTSLDPLESRDSFRLPERDGPATRPIERLARSLAAGSTTRYEASSRVLDWVARNVRYEMDRDRSQDPEKVLERRSGYCTGVARLTVSLLAAIDVPAREVPGYVFSRPGDSPHGYHRWVEIRYDDRGWVFSDPLATHHYIPATYVPLASERLLPGVSGDPGVLLERHDGRRVVDRVPWAPPGVTVRRNGDAQRAGALTIEVEGGGPAVRAVLRGGGATRSQVLANGRGSFLDLPPGTYLLRVEVPERPPILKRLVFRGAVVGAVRIPLG